MTDSQLLLLLLPVILIELGLILFALRDLLRPERRVRGDSKLMWGLIICFICCSGRSSTSSSGGSRNDGHGSAVRRRPRRRSPATG